MHISIVYLLGVISCLISLVTIFGNILVMIAVRCDGNLRRNKTNHFIFSLAVADLLIGIVVTPFAIYDDFTTRAENRTSLQVWPFGNVWCDFWHALDILCSTASILSLCIISLERYWAISDPISYPTKLTTRLSFTMIAVIWVCSSVISFPAIMWWRHVSPPNNKSQCLFTENSGYLIISSLISFYIPLCIMIVLYAKIYKTANELNKSVKRGAKIFHENGTNEEFVLRVHRGGTNNSKIYEKKDSNRSKASPDKSYVKEDNSNQISDVLLTPSITPRERTTYPMIRNDEFELSQNSNDKFFNLITARINNFRQFLHEQKTIRSLALIMGIFIICWFPFFSCNVIQALFPNLMGSNKPIIMNIVTWLGYTNSALNPIIYAYSMRDFRRAFLTILTLKRNKYTNGSIAVTKRTKKNIQIDYRLRVPLNKKSYLDNEQIE